MQFPRSSIRLICVVTFGAGAISIIQAGNGPSVTQPPNRRLTGGPQIAQVDTVTPAPGDAASTLVPTPPPTSASGTTSQQPANPPAGNPSTPPGKKKTKDTKSAGTKSAPASTPPRAPTDVNSLRAFGTQDPTPPPTKVPPARFGGQTTDKPSLNPEYRTCEDKELVLKATQLADRLRRKIEEWGVVTVSTPVIMPMNDRFALGANGDFPSFKDYLGKAETNIQASVSQFTQSAFSNQFAGQAAPLVPFPTPATPGTAAAATTTTTTTTSAANGPKPSDFSDAGASINLPTNSLLGNFNSQQFANPGSLIQSTSRPTGLSERQAQMIAANDMASQAMLREMLDPHDENDDVYINFVMVEISCNPGWRTKEGYTADCSAYCEYWNPCTGQAMAINERDQPVVYSVLPLLDAQTIDMANSERQLTSLVGQLSAAFPVHAVDLRAKDLIQFAKSFQRDAASRTAIPVVNSYSSGRTFGFRFSPSFRALKDPAIKRSGTANILTPTSFPALVTIVTRKSTYDALSQAIQSAQKNNPRIQPQIMTHVSTRWLLADRPKAYQVLRWLSWPALERENTGMRMDLARDTQEVYQILDYLTHKNETATNYACYSDSKSGKRESSYTGKSIPLSVPDYQLEELRRNVTELEAKGIGQSQAIDFLHPKPEAPPDATPVITAVAPQNFPGKDAPIPATMSLAILGKNFTDEMQVVIGGEVIESPKIYASTLITANVTWPPGTIVNASKQTVIPIILATKKGTVFDSTSFVVKDAPKSNSSNKTGGKGGGAAGGSGDGSDMPDNNGDNGQSSSVSANAINILMGDGIALNKVSVEASPKATTPPTGLSPGAINATQMKLVLASKGDTSHKPTDGSLTITTLKVTGVDAIAGAKLVADKGTLVGVGDATVSGDITNLTVAVKLTTDYPTDPTKVQSAKLELFTTTDTTGTPAVTSKAFKLPQK